MNEEIKKALDVLYNGGVILYPTDTVWGIGCDATNDDAVARIYEIKKRIDSKSMLVLLDSEAKLDRYVEEVPELAYDLIDMAAKPLTIIYEKAKNLSANLSKDTETIGIRITSEEFSRRLIERFRKPIVSTSANISGEASPACFSEITEEIKNAVDYVVDYRREETEGSPSSIIILGNHGEIQIVRE